MKKNWKKVITIGVLIAALGGAIFLMSKKDFGIPKTSTDEVASGNTVSGNNEDLLDNEVIPATTAPYIENTESYYYPDVSPIPIDDPFNTAGVTIKTISELPAETETLPDLSYTTLDDAAAYLSEQDIAVDITYSYDTSIPNGVVVEQKTPEGENFEEITIVEIVVNINKNEMESRSQGKDTSIIMVPDMVFDTVDDAIIKASNAGLIVEMIKDSERASEYPYLAENGCVLSYILNGEEENPDAELPKEAKMGDTITFFINAPDSEDSANIVPKH